MSMEKEILAALKKVSIVKAKRPKLGRPCIYKTPGHFEAAALEYLRACEAASRNPHPPGLARYLGMGMRSLRRYATRLEFGDAVDRIRTAIEATNTDALLKSGGGPAATPLLALLNAHFGWRRDPTDTELALAPDPMDDIDAERIVKDLVDKARRAAALDLEGTQNGRD
jgi:hypothetical protein